VAGRVAAAAAATAPGTATAAPGTTMAAATVAGRVAAATVAGRVAAAAAAAAAALLWERVRMLHGSHCLQDMAALGQGELSSGGVWPVQRTNGTGMATVPTDV